MKIFIIFCLLLIVIYAGSLILYPPAVKPTPMVVPKSNVVGKAPLYNLPNGNQDIAFGEKTLNDFSLKKRSCHECHGEPGR